MKKIFSVILLLLLFVCLLPSFSLAESAASPDAVSEPVIVSAGDSLYAYAGMTVYNNGGTLYNTGGTVYNNGGTVYHSGGTVYNNGGAVYARSGIVFHNCGTVYCKDADVFCFEENAGQTRVLGYYELKLADYYEPYVTLDGVTTEPGSEMMIISEDSVCHVVPRSGFRIAAAKSSSGTIKWLEDGSLTLTDVSADTTLKLTVRPSSSK